MRGDAASLRDDLLAIVARTPAWAALDERRRRGLATTLSAVADVSGLTGAVAVLLRTGATTGSTTPDVSTLTLSWLRTAPVLADLDLARLVVPGDDLVDTGLGPGVIARRIEDSPTGGDSITSQIAAPVPDSIWLAVLTGTATDVAHAPAMDDALLAFAASLQVDRPTA